MTTTDALIGEILLDRVVVTAAEFRGMLAAAVSSPGSVPNERLLTWWHAIHAADPTSASAVWRDAWEATDPGQRGALLVIAASLPDLDVGAAFG